MSKALLPLCSIKKITNRDGYVGALGRLFLPFAGYVFASGQQILESNTAAQIGQDQSLTMVGQVKPNIFSKTCCPTGEGDATGLA